MTTVLGGLPGQSTAVGFGTNAQLTSSGGVFDLTGGPGVLINNAFTVPRDGTITSLSAYFSSTAALALVGSTVTITAQIYTSPTPDNTLIPAPGALVTLTPPLTGVLAIGTVSSGLTTGLSIPVTAGSRVMLVFTATTTAGIDVATTISGYASGGVAIS